MSNSQELSRREALKTLGAGAAMLALGSLQTRAATSEASSLSPPAKAPPPQPFTLPQVDFAYDALEPYIDARTMEIHHTKHHQSYIDAANRALAEHPQWQKKTAEELLKNYTSLPEQLKTPVRNQVGGHVNHSQFWDILAPQARRTPGKELTAAIEHAFGSFDSFKVRFVDISMKRFGSGWAWLSIHEDGKLEVHSTPNQDSPYLTGLTPIIGLDVWEHAYYLHYQNRRLEYVEAFWHVLNWPEADNRFRQASGASS